jgi:hypothetical protein
MRTAATTYRRGQAGYDTALADTAWNERRPDRFPDVIVKAHSEDDVVGAVRAARAQDLKVAVRAGGYSWSASSIRDGRMLIDLSRLRSVTYDPSTQLATAQPGVHGSEPLKARAPHDRFFPTVHCSSVGLGWLPASGRAGLAVTTAETGVCQRGSDRGRDRRRRACPRRPAADPHQHSDLYWAARCRTRVLRCRHAIAPAHPPAPARDPGRHQPARGGRAARTRTDADPDHRLRHHGHRGPGPRPRWMPSKPARFVLPPSSP